MLTSLCFVTGRKCRSKVKQFTIVNFTTTHGLNYHLHHTSIETNFRNKFPSQKDEKNSLINNPSTANTAVHAHTKIFSMQLGCKKVI